VRVVPNKFPALRVEGDLERTAEAQYDRMAGVGAHEVVIETPDHEKDLAELPPEHIAVILKAYRERIRDLRNDVRLRYILVFKNCGTSAGASLAHSHSQVMATPVTPRTVAMELASARDHFQLKERCIFCDILAQELREGERVVLLDQFFVTHCMYASRFPFEMHLHPRQHSHDFALCSDDLLSKLAHHLKEVLRRMNKALNNPPYNFILHTAPSTARRVERLHYWETLEADWHWHFEILPRITRVAGFEWGTGFYINPTAPEEAARFLRQVDL
jgi:UDPglucose--hexose-1-phosphate uridylyltransferase